MSGSGAEIPRAGNHTPEAREASGGADLPGSSDDWAEKLRRARAKREKLLETRGTAGGTPQLVRPDLRPPSAPPPGTPPGAPPAREQASLGPAGRPAPLPAQSATPPERPSMAARLAEGSDRVSKALRRKTVGQPPETPRDSPRPPQPPAAATARPGMSVAAAFAMGLGVGLPVAAAVLFLAVRPGGDTETPQLAAEQVAAPAESPLDTLAVDLSAAPTAPKMAETALSDPDTAAIDGGLARAERVVPTDETAETSEIAKDIRSAAQAVTVPIDDDAPEPPEIESPETALAVLTPTPSTVRPTRRVSLPVPLQDLQGPRPDGTTLAQGPELRVYAPSRLSAAQIDAVATALAQAGAAAVTEVRTPLTIQDTHIRYYHLADAAEARALAETLGSEARDFTRFSPSPPEGLLEVWVAGRGAGSGPRAASPEPSVPDVARDLGNAISRLLSSIPPSDPQD